MDNVKKQTPDIMVALSVGGAETKKKKTLPYLAKPHHVTERQKEIKVIYKEAIFGQFHPYIGIGFHKSKSENDLQSGKTRLINFGLTASF